MESMGKTLQNLFKSYCSQLLKLDLLMAGKQDLIAVEEASLKSVFTSKVRNIFLNDHDDNNTDNNDFLISIVITMIIMKMPIIITSIIMIMMIMMIIMMVSVL